MKAIASLSHLLAVSALVWEDGGDGEQIIAALLHDAIEDAGQSHASIAERFGEGVADIVRDCTDTAEGWSGGEKEPWLLRTLKGRYERDLDRVLRRPRTVYVTTGVLLLGALGVLPFLGRSFLPPFSEGSLTVAGVSAPGITLEESDAIGREVEESLLAFPEVVSTSRRTGRAEKDEHVQGVNASEMEVVLRPGRPKEKLLAEMRKAVSTIPGAEESFGQPISHRIDHMVSGSKSNLAVKIFGPDLAVLRGLAARAEAMLSEVTGIVDLSNQEQASVPQLLIDFDRTAMARHGLSAASLARTVPNKGRKSLSLTRTQKG